MKPLLFLGSLLFAISSCSKKFTVGTPSSLSNDLSKKGSYLEKDYVVASISEDQSYQLLRNTIIPRVDWPEQSIVNRLALIDHEASKIGLSVEISPSLKSRPMIYPALRVRNISFAAAIQCTVDSTTLRYKIKDSGVLFFYLASEERSSPIQPEENAPF